MKVLLVFSCEKKPLRETCPYLEFFWSVFSHIRTEYAEIRSISPYSVRMWKNTDKKNSEYGHFSRSEHVRQDSCTGFIYQQYVFSYFPVSWHWSLSILLKNSMGIPWPYHINFFKDCLPQILLGPFLNTLSQLYYFGFSHADKHPKNETEAPCFPLPRVSKARPRLLGLLILFSFKTKRTSLKHAAGSFLVK